MWNKFKFIKDANMYAGMNEIFLVWNYPGWFLSFSMKHDNNCTLRNLRRVWCIKRKFIEFTLKK